MPEAGRVGGKEKPGRKAREYVRKETFWCATVQQCDYRQCIIIFEARRKDFGCFTIKKEYILEETNRFAIL